MRVEDERPGIELARRAGIELPEVAPGVEEDDAALGDDLRGAYGGRSSSIAAVNPRELIAMAMTVLPWEDASPVV